MYQVAKEWIGHDLKKRGKFTKRLLQKIRFPLLGRNTLENVLKTNGSSFKKNKDFRLAVNEIIADINRCKNKSNKSLTARYCCNDRLDIFGFGGHELRLMATGGRASVEKSVVNKIQRIENSDGFNSSLVVSSLVEKRYKSKVVYLRGNLYIFGGTDGSNGMSAWYDDRIIQKVEMYSLLKKECKVVADITDVNDQYLWLYAVCGFADKIYLLGGYDDDIVEADYCIEFDTTYFSWRQKSPMHDNRENPSACVFEERIIVSGGMQ